MADAEEAAGYVSVGGLAVDTGAVQPSGIEPRWAFTRFLDLARRQRGLTLEKLAEQADISLAELVSILEEDSPPAPRTVFKLAGVLGVSTRKLMELSGLAAIRDTGFAEAAVRFAARSEPTAALTKSERAALEEFVKVLVENTDSAP
ncbi:MAG TPA: helix-turn-helix transcriptional regulator [Longimicrobium sp.]|nr:helix-turn-helix transcriptional regulator [Longimicrobium sp.]